MKFDFDGDFQNQILASLIYSTSFLKAARNLIEPDHFSSDEQWTLCSLVYDFYDRYQKAPKCLCHFALTEPLKCSIGAEQVRS